MQYLRIENGSFGFIDDRLHEPNENDILITEDDYNKFFEMQSSGEQFRLKKTSSNASFLFDFVEAFELEKVEKKATAFDIIKELNGLKKQIETLEQKINEHKED